MTTVAMLQAVVKADTSQAEAAFDRVAAKGDEMGGKLSGVGSIATSLATGLAPRPLSQT